MNEISLGNEKIFALLAVNTVLQNNKAGVLSQCTINTTTDLFSATHGAYRSLNISGNATSPGKRFDARCAFILFFGRSGSSCIPSIQFWLWVEIENGNRHYYVCDVSNEELKVALTVIKATPFPPEKHYCGMCGSIEHMQSITGKCPGERD